MNVLVIPMSLPSRANLETGHWARHKLVKIQRKIVARFLVCLPRPDLPVTVLLSRISPRLLDSEDNLPMALKAPRDELAEWLGLPNDRDPRCRWLYRQAKDELDRPRYQALRITISPGLHDCPCCGHAVLAPIDYP